LEIRVENLEYVYNQGTPLEIGALHGITFTLSAGGFLGILGGTGSGKTTLVMNLNGLLLPTAGRVLVQGKETESWGGDLRRKVGVVFQRPERQLFEETVYEDISFVLRRFSDLDEDQIDDTVRKACELIKLDISEIADRNPLALSDGEKRKVAIAGVLVNEPEILVLDEPAVGLDPLSRVDLIAVLLEMRRSRDKSVVIVSHDMEPFMPLLDHLLVLDQGRAAAYGPPAEVCRELVRQPGLAELLPGLVLLVNDLRNSGADISENEFRASAVADRIADLLGCSGKDN